MKTESGLLIFVLILNLSVMLVTDLGRLGVIPGATRVQQLNATGTTDDYTERFNATYIIREWNPPAIDIPIVGDIVGALAFMFDQIQFIIIGFPIFLWDLGAVYITDSTGLAVWQAISGTIAAVFAIYMSWFIIQLITGRITNE